MTIKRAGAFVVGAFLLSTVPVLGRAQLPAGGVDVPAGMWSPPVALIVGSPDASGALASALKLNGVASLAVRPDSGKPDEERIRLLADRLMALRNDPRFPTVVVIGQGASARDAAIVARVARADGFIAVSPQDAETELGRLVVDVFKATDAAAAAKDIADFARNVPALGRRGTRERRPDTERRSPRTLVLATVGGTLVGIEYGQPQRRERTIWGVLVPWNREWMPGADESTTMTTTAVMQVGDLTVPAGDHSFYFMPRQDRSQLLISRDVGQFHIVFDRSLVIGAVDMTLARRTDHLEGLTFAIDAGLLKLAWDDREYSASIAAIHQ